MASNLSDYVDKFLLDSWISLLNESHDNREGQKKSAAAMLDFSFKCRQFDPTEMLVAAFPIVYKSFLNGNPIIQFFPFHFFQTGTNAALSEKL